MVTNAVTNQWFEFVTGTWHLHVMLIAETVTFGGSGLDRAAHLRRDTDQLANDPQARTIVFWRGKVMANPNHTLVRLSLDHSLLSCSSPDRIFLGQNKDQPIFATDISAWVPDAYDPEAAMAFLDEQHIAHPLMPEASFVDLRAAMTLLTPRDAELGATGKAILEWHRSHRFCAKCGAKSAIAMSGWQRDCAACGTHHFPRTDPVVIMLITHGNAVLMGRSPGWPEGMYSLLAGFIEPGETIEAAVRREVFEEAGVRVGQVSYLASQPWPFPASLMMGCAGEAVSQEIKIDPSEIEDACWVTREQMADVFAGQHPFIKPARKGAIAHFLLESWLADRLD